MLCSTAVLQVPGIRHQMDRVLELHLNMFEGGAVRLDHPAAPSLIYTLVPDLNPVRLASCEFCRRDHHCLTLFLIHLSGGHF